jgi:hypothetical protein
MATWKKVVVSGSNISHLVNDAGYLTNAGGIANAESASVAARATTLSPNATASFALVAGTSRNADSASVAARATTLSADATASFADLASDARTATSASIAATADSASVAARATTLSNLATASFADLASSARSADSASVAARATALSADATASFADLASTVHDGNITTDKIADSNVTNAKLQNDSITFGTTAQALGSTVTSISGLTSISATTGSFVLQVFESASTIITSGSNIFGDKANDIQQITGSLTQTGSFVLSGSLLQSHGTISGSFEGDGSGLTGLATVLTVDGDTGTQDVDLISDDLQILGTTDEITTAVTKVGNDVKVTLGLPDTIAVTASVATRANALSPLATASFADLASDARTATSASFATQAGTSRTADSASVAARATTLSADATASFALIAGTSRNADSASVAARATELSTDATASFADLASDARTATSASYASKTDYGTSANTAVQGNITLEVLGTTNEITVTNGTATALGSNRSITLALPDDVTIGQDLTVTRDLTVSRNLTVQGTASFQATTDLDIADRFIRLASGSNAAGEGGFVVQQGDNGLGEVFGYDQTTLRFGVSSSFDAQLNVFTPDAFFTNVIEGGDGDAASDTIAKYTKKGNTFVANNGDIYIYS